MNIHARNLPLSVWLLGLPGLVCLVGSLVLAMVDLGQVHPLLDGAGAALALAVSGVALLGSAGFPLVLDRLARADAPSEAAADGRDQTTRG